MLLYLGASDAVPALKVKGSVRKHLEILKEKPGRSYGASLYTKLQETEAGYFWMVKVGSTWDSQAGEPAGYLGEDTGFLYGDSRINGSPCHKPEYNPEYLHGFNYIGSSWAVRKDLYLSFTGDCPSYAFWNYRMILFLTGNIDLQQHTNPDRIRRIPQILFEEHQAQKKEIWEQELQALKEEFAARSCPAKVKRGSAYGTFRISYPLAETPLVSIIIPNMNHKEDLKRCLDSIREKSTYQNYEILIVENNSSDPEIFAYYEELKQQADIRILIWKGEFNYSAINNFGVSRAKGQYYLLLNNDVEVITPDWIQEMLMYVQQSENGAAGAMLYYPNETVQHGGVILGIGGVAGHSQKNYPRGNTGYYNRLCVPQDLTAVTAACILVRKDVYEEVQGLDEEYKVAFNDVDFCMKIRKSGYRIVFTPYAELYHYESISRGVEDTPQKVQRFGSEVIRFQTKWSRELAQGDPYYNPNLSLEKDDFSLA
jgi:GT2 family glycosyltransferase